MEVVVWLTVNDDIEREYERIKEKLSPHFSEPFGGYYPPQGWMYLIEALHDDLLRVDPDYRIGQVKEKFGGLRYYIDIDHSVPEDISDEEYESVMNERWDRYKDLQIVVTLYEKRSLSICQNCSATPAELRERNRWVSTLCDDCFSLD